VFEPCLKNDIEVKFTLNPASPVIENWIYFEASRLAVAWSVVELKTLAVLLQVSPDLVSGLVVAFATAENVLLCVGQVPVPANVAVVNCALTLAQINRVHTCTRQ